MTRSGEIIDFEGFQLFAGEQKRQPTHLKSWIKQFVTHPNNQWFIEIEDTWAGDWFNQHGISDQFEDFDKAVALMTDKKGKEFREISREELQRIHQQAVKIYGLLHARYIVQPNGLKLMKKKFDQNIFGKCPRYACGGCKLIPMGQTFRIRRHSVKLFCPMCCDIYKAPSYPVIDGAYFGPSFPHVFVMEYHDELDKSEFFKKFELRAFGFRIRKSSDQLVMPHETNIHEDDEL